MLGSKHSYLKFLTISLLGLILLICLVACGNDSKKEFPADLDVALYRIHFLDKNVYLPSGFEVVNLNELGEMLRQNPDLEEPLKTYYQIAASINANSGVSPQFFTHNYKSQCIWFTSGSYIELTKEKASIYEQMMDRNYIQPLRESGAEIKLIERKFITKKNTKIIKLKYEQNFPRTHGYMTQYLVTYRNNTFSIMVANTLEEDFSFILDNFSSY